MSPPLQEDNSDNTMNNTIVYHTHYVSAVIKRELNRLADEVPSVAIWVTGYCKTDADIFSLNTLATDRISVAAYSKTQLLTLPYTRKLATMDWDNSRGNNDLALLKFFQDHPEYKKYCFIEYDVRCTGSWNELMTEIFDSKADLICTHVSSYSHNDDWWPHWSAVNTSIDDDQLASEYMIRAFLPFCCISQKGLQEINDAYRKGWVGHPEAVWPTALKLAHLSIEDLGGDGDATPLHRRGKYYYSAFLTPELMISTFGIFPIYLDDEIFTHNSIKDTTLWHPVKEISIITS